MSSDDDYDPSQDFSQRMYPVERLSGREAGFKSLEALDELFDTGGAKDSQTSDTQYIDGLIRRKLGQPKADIADFQHEVVDHSVKKEVTVKQESNTVLLDERKAVSSDAVESANWQKEKHMLLTENTALKESLSRCRQRTMDMIHFWAALKAVEVEAERRFHDVTVILENLGFQVPNYPQRMETAAIRQQTDEWYAVLIQRWNEGQAAEDALFGGKDNVPGAEQPKRESGGENSLKRPGSSLKYEYGTVQISSVEKRPKTL